MAEQDSTSGLLPREHSNGCGGVCVWRWWSIICGMPRILGRSTLNSSLGVKFFFCLFVLVFWDRVSLCNKQLGLFWELLCRPRWLRTHRDLYCLCLLSAEIRGCVPSPLGTFLFFFKVVPCMLVNFGEKGTSYLKKKLDWKVQKY